MECVGAEVHGRQPPWLLFDGWRTSEARPAARGSGRAAVPALILKLGVGVLLQPQASRPCSDARFGLTPGSQTTGLRSDLSGNY